LQRQASDVNARLVEQQILLSRQEVLKSTQEVELLKKQEDKIDQDILQIKQNILTPVPCNCLEVISTVFIWLI
jgi:hypothetical protein